MPASVEAVYLRYLSLAAVSRMDPQSGLGGTLLYAGAIHFESCSLLYAANLAGAASLAASADAAAQRQAMRDGVIDFMVTTLEEALRILKNEVRKKQPVSVGVAIDPRILAESMLDRGVLPDLLPPVEWDADIAGFTPEQRDRFASDGAQPLAPVDPPAGEWMTWSVDREPARWLPRLDACARASIPADDFIRQRWLSLAPRYLGRLMQRQHGLALTAAELAEFHGRVEKTMADATQEGEAVRAVIRR